MSSAAHKLVLSESPLLMQEICLWEADNLLSAVANLLAAVATALANEDSVK